MADYKGKRGKAVSSKSAGNKLILGWDRNSSSIPTNSFPANQYAHVPDKRFANIHSPRPQWTGGTSSPITTNPKPDHVNQASSSPMPSMSLVLEPKFVPTLGLPSNFPPLTAASHNNPMDQQMDLYGKFVETSTPVNPFMAPNAGEFSNPVFQPDDLLNFAGDNNSDLNLTYDYPISSYNNGFSDSPTGGSSPDMVSKLLYDYYGLIWADKVPDDYSAWWMSDPPTSVELLCGEVEMDDADWPASRQLERALMYQELLACAMPSSSAQPKQE